jgi:uncharacterized membrane protein YphA (DoxX/SURF4 family)
VEIQARPRWSTAQRIAFRFFFSYFCLFFIADRLVRTVPFSDLLLRKYTTVWYLIVGWLEGHVLHTGYEVQRLDDVENISNTFFGTILFLCYVTLAAVATVVWSTLDRKRVEYERLHQVFRYLLRFSLALTMISYGILKVIPTQMISPPPLGMLKRPIGDFTPMMLLWTFMGASPAYESLTGCAELLGGILLLVPRTTLLGAAVCLANMTMVFTLNMCYDVHVKLYSLHLWLMAALLVAPDLHRLAALFLFNRTVEPAVRPPLFGRRATDRALQALLFLVGLIMIAVTFVQTYERYQTFHPPKPPLYGVWTVEDFTVDGREVPMDADPRRWRWVTFRDPGALWVEHRIGSRQKYDLALDMKRGTMILGKEAVFSFARPQEDVLLLNGTLDGHRTRAKLTRMALLRRRFHWIFVAPKEDL